MDNGEELNGKIMVPVGYDSNKNIKLTDILSLDDAISLIIGYSHMILSTVSDGKTLTDSLRRLELNCSEQLITLVLKTTSVTNRMSIRS